MPAFSYNSFHFPHHHHHHHLTRKRYIPTSFRSMSYRPLSLLTNSWKKKELKRQKLLLFLLLLLDGLLFPLRPSWLCRVVCTVYSDEERVSDLSVASGRPTSPVASLSAALSRRQTVHFQRVSPVLQIQHVLFFFLRI